MKTLVSSSSQKGSFLPSVTENVSEIEMAVHRGGAGGGCNII